MTATVFEGTTIVFGTSGFSADVTGISWGGVTREAINQSHAGSTNAHSFVPADLYDPGELTLDIHHTAATAVPFNGATETITITFPDTDKWAASGFMTGYEFTGEMDDKYTASMTVKFTGAITITDTP